MTVSPLPAEPACEVLAGLVERVTFHNGDNGLCVLRVKARGGVGARSLNIDPQIALNPDGAPKVTKFGWTFAPGDEVMQIENGNSR